MSEKKPVLESGKRKMAVARALVRPGHGRVWINGIPLQFHTPELARMRIEEPLIISGERAKNVDIRVRVFGGGFMGQADAARIAVARGLVKFAKSSELKRTILSYDRIMLAGDPRTTEPKKFGGPGPRRRKQKSYR